jgi:hypothetical protein
MFVTVGPIKELIGKLITDLITKIWEENAWDH